MGREASLTNILRLAGLKELLQQQAGGTTRAVPGTAAKGLDSGKDILRGEVLNLMLKFMFNYIVNKNYLAAIHFKYFKLYYFNFNYYSLNTKCKRVFVFFWWSSCCFPLLPLSLWKSELNIRKKKKKKVRKSNTIAFKNNIFSHFQLCQSERKITPNNILL